MFSAIVVKEIRDSNSGHAYKVGDRVRVLKKTKGEHIGIIKEIYNNGFDLMVDGYERQILFMDIDKMRAADPGENFYNRFDF